MQAWIFGIQPYSSRFKIFNVGVVGLLE